jgi:hypothetical protein
MNPQRRFFPLFVLLGCIWVIALTASSNLVADWVLGAISSGAGPYGAGTSVASAAIMSISTAVGYSAFGYVVAAAALVTWLNSSPWIRYAHLLIAMLVTTIVLAGFEYASATLLSDEKFMAFGIASRNQGARVWYCTITVFIMMRFISLALGVVIEAPESERVSRRFGVGHLMRLTAMLAVLFLSMSLFQDQHDGSFDDLGGDSRLWLWVGGVALITVASLVSWIRERIGTPLTDNQKPKRTIIRWLTLIAAVAVLIGSTQWFDYFSDNFMAWFQIDWSIPNPIPVRGQAWDIMPSCALASLGLCVPLSCGIWSTVNLRGKIAFALALLLAPVWSIVTADALTSYYGYPLAVGIGILLSVLPTIFATWRLLNAGAQFKL